MPKLVQTAKAVLPAPPNGRSPGWRLPAGFTLAALALIWLCGCQSNEPAGKTADAGGKPKSGRPAASAPMPPETIPLAQPSWRPIAGRVVVLDAGHGGNDFGASHNGLREKDICLDLALRTAAILRAGGVTVFLTRQTDVYVPLPERSAFANHHPGAVLVSVHVNASDRNAGAAGIETYILDKEIKDADREKTAAGRYHVQGSDSLRGPETLASLTTQCRKEGPALAGAIQKQLARRLAVPDRGVRSKNLAVLRETYFCPAVLVEVGFLTHAGTANEMRTGEWRRRAAEGLAEGVADFLRQPAGT